MAPWPGERVGAGAGPHGGTPAGSATLQVVHETRYDYAQPVELAHHVAFLQPLDDERQRLLAHALQVDPPPPSGLRRGRDVFGNVRQFFGFSAPHRTLLVRATSTVRLHAPASFDPAATVPWETVRERLRFVAGAPFDPASQFVAPSPYVPRLAVLRELAAEVFVSGAPIASAAQALMHRLHGELRYESESTAIDTPLAEVWMQRRGVCQDFAHLMIGALRAIGLAARYVSGYLLTTPAPGEAPLQGADASHAWVAVYCPGVPGDWLELDPTNDLLPALAHVRLAVGRDYGDVTPLRGVIRGGGRHALQVRVRTESV